MDKLTQYRTIIEQVMEEVEMLTPSEQDGVRYYAIRDRERGHYLMYQVGWRNRQRLYGAFVHIDLHPDGKVWLEHDGTDLNIADDLLEKGIPKADIVLGLQAPHLRALGGFADA
ncbi:MAG: XisI protein [Bacteroidota bacterium]